MDKRRIGFIHKRVIYLCAWLAYMVFVFYGFAMFSITTFQISIALSILAAWLYGYAGCIITTALSIPFHYLILIYYFDNPLMWKEALNPFGISTQLLVSGAVAVIRHTKIRIERLNENLEYKVEERTKELHHLQHYILQNQESAQVVLSHMVLGDIGDCLVTMLSKSDLLLNNLIFEDSPASSGASRLNLMIKKSLDVVQHLEFIDSFYKDNQIDYESAVMEVAEHFSQTTGVNFDFDIHKSHSTIPRYIQHQLYRITQEAITNAVRHGMAENISVQLEITNKNCQLSVINDGNPLPTKIESGLGLKLMQHRTQQLGGSLSWQTTADGWTKLDCSIPHVSD